jgi:hypothetical protein
LTPDDYAKIADSVKHETQVFDAYRLKVFGAEDGIKELNLRITRDRLSLSSDEIDAELSRGVD